MTNESVWIVDDDSSIRWVLQKALQTASIGCLCFENPQDLLLQLQSGQAPEVIISDIKMPQMDGMTLLNEVHATHPMMPVIIMTAHSDLDSAVNAYQKGAFEYLPKPFDIDEAVTLTQRALAHAREQSKTQQAPQDDPETEIIGEAPAMQEVFRAIGRLSQSNITVLINGESGTGKELVAHALHRHSPRRENPFIALNMAAIPRDLMESELFGHEKGSFTGAQGQRRGRFEQADGGTLFLDEIGDMPTALQPRLLRVLQERQVIPVGGGQPIPVDFDLICATHTHLSEAVGQGLFRQDLYYRINGLTLNLPPLREREDIRSLIDRVLAELGGGALSPASCTLLENHPWPGNLRQLHSVLRTARILCDPDQPIEPEHLSADFLAEARTAGPAEATGPALADWERQAINTALENSQGNVSAAARELNIDRTTLHRKLKHLSGHSQ